MRYVTVALLLAASSAQAAQPYCALPSPSAMAAAESGTGAAPTAAMRPASREDAGSASASADLSPSLRALPFIAHVAASGATLYDLGASHGMQAIGARQGDQFMLFQVTPDGQAAVSGAITELTPEQLSLLAGGETTELGTLHGLRGLYVRSGPQFQVFYATPDGQRLVPGVLWDASGKELTRAQVAGIPGAVPTVVVGDAQAGQEKAASGQALALVQKAVSGTVGPASAPHLWMLVDPQCIYSVRAYQALQPFVASGRLQLTVIPVSVLDHEDQGQSTRSALALLSKPAEQLVAAWQAGSVSEAPSLEAASRLRANMAISGAIGLKGTPTFVWTKQDGTEGRMDGMPSSMDALVASVGR